MTTEPAADNDPDYAERLMNEQEAANFLGFSVRALQNWRLRGGGPMYVRKERSVRYRRRELIRWADARLVSSTSERAPLEEQPTGEPTSAAAPEHAVRHSARQVAPATRQTPPAVAKAIPAPKSAEPEPASESPQPRRRNPFDPFNLRKS